MQGHFLRLALVVKLLTATLNVVVGVSPFARHAMSCSTELADYVKRNYRRFVYHARAPGAARARAMRENEGTPDKPTSFELHVDEFFKFFNFPWWDPLYKDRRRIVCFACCGVLGRVPWGSMRYKEACVFLLVTRVPGKHPILAGRFCKA
jgi:hypothetical protein